MSKRMLDKLNLGIVFHCIEDDQAIPVAFVRCLSDRHDDALEECFTLTNNIECPWTLNPGVIPSRLRQGAPRSTSVGDYVQLGRHIYRCEGEGWVLTNPNWLDFIGAVFCRSNWRMM